MKVAFARSIGAKLFGLISIALGMTVASVSLQNHQRFRDYLDRQIADDMVNRAKESTNAVRAVIENWSGQIALVMHSLDRLDEADTPATAQGFVEANREFLAFDIVATGASGQRTMVHAMVRATEEEARFDDKDPVAVESLLKAEITKWVGELEAARAAGATKTLGIYNLGPATGLPLMALAMPFESQGEKGRQWAVLTAWQTRVAAALPASKRVQAQLIDDQGRVFAAQVVKAAVEGASLKDRELTKAALSGDAPFGFKTYERDGASRLGAFHGLPELGAAVLVERDAREAYQAIDGIVKRTALWACLFVLVGVLLAWFVSSGMTRNIRIVAQSTQRIAGGDFEDLTMPKSRDEIGGLGQAIQDMARQIQGLLQETVEKARMESELDTAHMVQRTFIPDRSIESGPIKVTGRHQTASECGGDWWGHFTLTPGVEFLCIADATGHGVPAALLTAMVYSSAMTIAENSRRRGDGTLSPADVLQQINALLWTAGQGRLTMTFQACVIDTRTGEMTVANAGHVFPMVVPKDSDDARLPRKEGVLRRRYKQLIARGGILGMSDTLRVAERKFKLEPGDRLVLYTDGMTECMDEGGKAYGLPGVNDALVELADRDAERIKGELIDRVLAFNGDKPLADDITVVVTEIDPSWRAEEERKSA